MSPITLSSGSAQAEPSELRGTARRNYVRDRLRDGWLYRRVALALGVSEARIGQIAKALGVSRRPGRARTRAE